MAVYNEEQAEELKAFGLNMVDISLFGDEVKTFAIGFTDSDYVAPELQGIVAMDKLDHERLHSSVSSGSMPIDMAGKIRHQNSMLERGFSDAKSERARLTTVCVKCYVNPATDGSLCFDCCGTYSQSQVSSNLLYCDSKYAATSGVIQRRRYLVTRTK